MSYNKIILEYSSNCRTCNGSLILPISSGGCGCRTAQIPCSTSTSNSPCADCDEPCDGEVSETDCMTYSGADIPQLSIKNGDKVTKIIITLAAELIVAKQRIATLESA